MAPHARPGDHLQVDLDEPTVNGWVVAVRDGEVGEATMRLHVEKDRRRVLRALKRDWRERVVNWSDETDILSEATLVEDE